MIISASFRTDIPAFYSKWFKNRLEAEYCKVINPYSNQPYRVDLTKSKVNAFVLWTKNIAPCLENLSILRSKNFPFLIQYGINNYPATLEGRVITLSDAIEHIKFLSKSYGKHSVVWRYDPIVVTTHTPLVWHIQNFYKIATQLKGLVDEVIVSFMQFYKKTTRNIAMDNNLKKIKFIDPELRNKKNTITQLAEIANKCEMRLSLCTQPDLISGSIKPASCIDLNRLSDIAGYKIKGKIKGNRPGCYCAKSRDIGAYDTCPHGCVYCYAVSNPKLVRLNLRRHDPNNEFLIPPK